MNVPGGSDEAVKATAIEEFLDRVLANPGLYVAPWRAFSVVANFDGTRLTELRAAGYTPGAPVEELFPERRNLRGRLEAVVGLFEDSRGHVPRALVFRVEGSPEEIAFRMDLAYDDSEAERYDIARRGFDEVMADLNPFGDAAMP